MRQGRPCCRHNLRLPCYNPPFNDAAVALLPRILMNKRLSNNNFDLLRLILAAIVCLVHSAELSGFPELGLIPRFISSGLAVQGFFVVSGFLIFMSFERSTSVRSYFQKRLRRIYPAYFVVVVLCATLLVLVSDRAMADYFSVEWVKYLAANLSFMNFLHPTLPGVFEQNKVTAVNGALWTLKIEMMFYFCVPLIVMLCRKISYLPVLAVLYLLSMFYGFAISPYNAELGRQLPGQLAYFMAGAFFYYFLPFFERHLTKFLLAAVLALVFKFTLLQPLAIATTVIFAALYFSCGNFGKYGDFSYGFYILHFPVIQVFLWTHWFDGHPWAFLLSVVAVTGMGAIAMWHFVEKRFLSKSSHYIGVLQAADKPAAEVLHKMSS
jgi:peptidoglycan/LPS O-acetylase OafA/YrhL